MKFERRKIELTEGKIEVHHTLVSDDPAPFLLIADREGVRVGGELRQPLLLTNREELDRFAKALADAWKDHRSLVPVLTMGARGH